MPAPVAVPVTQKLALNLSLSISPFQNICSSSSKQNSTPCLVPAASISIRVAPTQSLLRSLHLYLALSTAIISLYQSLCTSLPQLCIKSSPLYLSLHRTLCVAHSQSTRCRVCVGAASPLSLSLRVSLSFYLSLFNSTSLSRPQTLSHLSTYLYLSEFISPVGSLLHNLYHSFYPSQCLPL